MLPGDAGRGWARTWPCIRAGAPGWAASFAAGSTLPRTGRSCSARASGPGAWATPTAAWAAAELPPCPCTWVARGNSARPAVEAAHHGVARLLAEVGRTRKVLRPRHRSELRARAAVG